MREFINFFKFFYKLTGNSIFFLLLIMIFTGLFEIVGVSFFFPIIAGDNVDNPLIKLIHSMFDFLSIQCSMLNLLIFMVVFFFIRTTFMIIQTTYVAKFSADLLVNLRVKTVRRFFESDYILFLSKDSGFFSNAFMNEFHKLTSALSMFFHVLMGIIFSFFYIVLPLFLAPKLVLFVVCSGLLGVVVVVKINEYTRNYSVSTSKHHALLHSILIQTFQNFKYLKSTFSYRSLIKKIDTESQKLGKLSVNLAFFQVLMSDGFIPFVFIILSVLIYYQIEIVGVPLDETLFILVLIYQSFTKAINLQAGYRKLLSNIGSIKVYQELDNELISKKEIDIDSGLPADLNQPIKFENVSFNYPDGKNILCDININIPPRSTVAFVGMSGAGKSTILTLLTGVIKPTKGKILLGEQPYNSINQKTLRQRIGYVTQESVIFNDSISNNITFWNNGKNNNRQQIKKAAERAHIDKFIETLPNRYETLLGENGILISGGQRQRISIARELYKNVEMIIFDEATSSLDSESEREIQKNIEELRGQSTVILVSHRLSTIINSDIIFVVEHGRIVEQGGYEELYNKEGKFRCMVDSQSMDLNNSN